MEAVQQILEQRNKAITVEKHIDVDIDVGSLLAVDPNDLNVKSLSSVQERDQYLKSLTRDNTQILLNKVWELSTERIDDAIVVRLPQTSITLPREKHIPKPKPLTKWQEFAKNKGITKKKKDKLKWDDQLQKWVPLFGFKRVAAEKEKNWVIEVPQNVDPMTDMYEKKANEKSEKHAKNELQRLKNVARARKVNIPRVGLPTSDKATATQLAAAATIAKASTASLGQFQAKLPKEKEAKNVKDLIPGKDRKRKAPIPTPTVEKEHNMKIINNIINKKPKIDVDREVDKHISKDVKNNKDKVKTSRKRKAKSDNVNNFSAKKPKGGKGERNPHKKSGGHGRKRR